MAILKRMASLLPYDGSFASTSFDESMCLMQSWIGPTIEQRSRLTKQQQAADTRADRTP